MHLLSQLCLQQMYGITIVLIVLVSRGSLAQVPAWHTWHDALPPTLPLSLSSGSSVEHFERERMRPAPPAKGGGDSKFSGGPGKHL